MIPRVVATAAKRVATGAAAASAATAAGPGPSRCLERPPTSEIDVTVPKSNKEVAQELHTRLEKDDDGWLLAERVFEPIDRLEVFSTLQELVDCGSAGSLVLQHEPRPSSVSSEVSSVESIGQDADLLMAEATSAMTQQAQLGKQVDAVLTLNSVVPDLVADLLSDPGVQRECFRALQASPAFSQLLRSGPLALPPPPPTTIYLAPGTAEELGLTEQGSISDPMAAALAAIASGLQALGDKVNTFFGSLGNRLRRAIGWHPNSPSDADKWVGGIFAAAVAVLAIILLKRGGRTGKAA